MNIEIMIPSYQKGELEKTLEKAKKNLGDELSWSVGEPYKKVFHHAVKSLEHGFTYEKYIHEVCDVVVSIPDVNDWELLCTITDGAMEVTNRREKLVFKNPQHGVDYHTCDVCGHHTWKKFYVVLNTKTGEELQVGSECARKFGIGLVVKIYKLTNDLYKMYDLFGGESCDDGLTEWPQHFSDPYARASVELSRIFQACKDYYDNNNGVWLKGYYQGRTYVPSQSANEIINNIDNCMADDDDQYFKELQEWVRNEFHPEEYNDFDQQINDVGDSYYFPRNCVAPVFFAIKKFEQWKKERDAKAKGLYLPKWNDYIHIVGKVVQCEKKEGYFGSYKEYTIYNEIDNNTYKRAGAVKFDEDTKHVECYAYIKNVWQGNYTLDRTTIKAKKGISIANEM